MRAAVIYVSISLCVLMTVGAALAQQQPDVPYVPTPWNVVEAMLDTGQVGAADYLIDLGAGDGRVVIEAARQRGARGLGIELDGNLVHTATREAVRLGVGGKAKFISGNLFSFDFSGATVLTMYLLPKINLELRSRILNTLKPGTRVVSHDFDMGEWKPDLRREIAVPNKSYGPPVSQIYLWYVPANAAGRWQWRAVGGGPAVGYEATFNQKFQELAVVVEGGAATVGEAKLRGDKIGFTLTHEAAGEKKIYEYSGRIDGDSIEGSVKTAGDSRIYAWKAARLARGEINID